MDDERVRSARLDEAGAWLFGLAVYFGWLLRGDRPVHSGDVLLLGTIAAFTSIAYSRALGWMK